jgi:hypothetical protein
MPQLNLLNNYKKHDTGDYFSWFFLIMIILMCILEFNESVYFTVETDVPENK